MKKEKEGNGQRALSKTPGMKEGPETRVAQNEKWGGRIITKRRGELALKFFRGQKKRRICTIAKDRGQSGDQSRMRINLKGRVGPVK